MPLNRITALFASLLFATAASAPMVGAWPVNSNLGNIEYGKTGTTVVTVQNLGKNTQRIELSLEKGKPVPPPGVLYEYSPKTLYLPAGGKAPVVVTVKPTKVPGLPTEGSGGAQVILVITPVSTQGPTASIAAKINFGLGKKMISQNASVSCGHLYLGGKHSATVKLTAENGFWAESHNDMMVTAEPVLALGGSRVTASLPNEAEVHRSEEVPVRFKTGLSGVGIYRIRGSGGDTGWTGSTLVLVLPWWLLVTMMVLTVVVVGGLIWRSRKERSSSR